MKTDIPVFELIDQCEFDIDNPFELENGLFPNLRNHFPSKMVDLLEKRIYHSWIDAGFIGESTVCVFYDIITNRLLKDRYNGYFDHLTQDELNQISEEFADVIEDEIRHREIFLRIIKKTGISSGHDITDVDHNNPNFKLRVERNVQSDLYIEDSNTACLLGHVCPMLIGETYLLASFNMFYQMSTNPNKQQIFKSLLQDESRHVNHFKNLLKTASINKDDADRLKQEIINNIYDSSNFQALDLASFVQDTIKLQEKIDIVFQEVYNNPFHQHFRELFLRKVYQFYSVIYPETTEEEFNAIMNPLDFSRIIHNFNQGTNMHRNILLQKTL